MRIVNYFNKSLSRQILLLMGICFLFFIIGTGLLFYFQHKSHAEYIQQREKIEDKQLITDDIYEQLSSRMLIMDDTLSIIVPESSEAAPNIETEIQQQIIELEQLIDNEEEKSFISGIGNFSSFYFSELLPFVRNEYEGNQERSVDLYDRSVIQRADEFVNQTKLYSALLHEQIEKNAEKLSENQLHIQNSVVILSIFLLILLLFIIRMFFKKIGEPIAEFTFSANEIAAGRDAIIEVGSTRKDELGTLSVAFKKMVESIQDKEQDLLAQNEELSAQQEELQAQQQELQSTLEIITDREHKLKDRNELINGISSSLNKEKVLQSIVESMCKVTETDKGIISYLNEDAFAACGISQLGIEQFRNHMDSDLIHRLITEKKAFTIKREQHHTEKGYHETIQYSYDLYLPVISNFCVIAVMVYTRFGNPFSASELTEYDILSRQIAIYLEKIRLFEQSKNDSRLNQDILNTVQEGIQLIDKDNKIIQLNQPLCKIFKWSDPSKELLGLPWDKWSCSMEEQIQEDDFIDSLEKLIHAAKHSPNEDHSFIYRMKDSNQVIKVYSKILQDFEDDFGMLLVHRDITKENEVAEMKSELVSTVSHELRTPLASVLGFTELLLTKELKPERKTKYLQTIYNEAKRLTALINDFLDIQRMESGKQTYEKKYIDIQSILQHVIKLQEINTSIHKINFIVETEETIILGDQSKIGQVFTNLLSNAIKYSPNGGNIFIRIYRSKDTVSIDIKDEGLGIPEDAIPHLFQQFYRVDNSDRRKIGGTGLGLAIVQEIAKAHRGIISVSSVYGKGSTFTVHLPLVRMKSSIPDENSDTSMNKYTIMIVEDDPSLAELLKHELQDWGFSVNQFSSGKKAFEQMKLEAPDTVVLDIMLEDEIDGWTIMKEMKAREELSDVPIFVSTALDEKELGFSLGAQDYLVKPYKPSQLSKLIMQTLLSNEKDGQILVPHKQS
ncbi:histidine kinase [Oceanobacillus arenosus]|uniref:histidine kinase n=1 Tax=Oceanobacillus arenosus TaxID=1229153 RepID=A0A3D8Q2K9_9BACI|nr:ATP-binding protein [Oceanobacillus arenosus]RDW21868.1 histidine kinase [Oceanobacillus arenosus]